MKLRSKPFCNELHFFLFGVILLFLSIYQPFFYIGLVIYLIFIIKKTRYIMPLGILLLCLYLSYTYTKLNLKELDTKEYEGTYEVVDVFEKEVILKGTTKLIIFSSIEDLTPGDIISARVKIYSLDEASYAGDFDAKSYYQSKGITNRGRLLKYEITGFKWTTARVRYTILQYYKRHLDEKSFAYVKTLFFGISELDKEVKSAYSTLYISHLLAISGFHITFLYTFLLYFFRKLFRIQGEKITLLILGIYVFLIGCPTSCLRAFLFLAIGLWNKKGQIQYTKLDIFSISFIGMAFLFPFKVFQSGFILSFIISFIWIFMKDYNLSNNKMIKAFQSSLVCIFSILPFLVNQTYQISILGILVSFILGYIFGKAILPIILVILVMPCFLYEKIFQVLDYGLLFIAKHTISLSLSHISIFGIVIYYIIFLYVLICLAKNIKKYTLLYIPLYIIILFSLRFSNPYYKVTFIDVGQGDSILIEFPHNQGNVLVDSYTGTVEYLKNRGIRKIDCVVLSHFDNDHMGTIDAVIENFQVDVLLYSPYENENKIKDLQVKKKTIQGGNEFKVGKISFQVFGPITNLMNSNSNSIVLKFQLGNYNFLFTGDMTIEEENELIETYGSLLDSDILKVGHHGSKTSSSDSFLKLVSPIYSIISVGKENNYGLPNSEVIERLEKFSTIFMTKDSGNVEITIKKQITISGYRKNK